MPTISRNEYVGLFGPTTGDRIRLGDTGLFVEIECDLRGAHGDEIVFGGGKSLREGMGMDNKLTYADGPPDLVITNVTIIDAVQGVADAVAVEVHVGGNPLAVARHAGIVRHDFRRHHFEAP
jgi:urease subunit alpha